jgi:hypothetical protein
VIDRLVGLQMWQITTEKKQTEKYLEKEKEKD